MDCLINYLMFLFMCFTGQQSLDRRLRPKLTDAHDGGMSKGEVKAVPKTKEISAFESSEPKASRCAVGQR
jgi:hypothetical protein